MPVVEIRDGTAGRCRTGLRAARDEADQRHGANDGSRCPRRLLVG